MEFTKYIQFSTNFYDWELKIYIKSWAIFSWGSIFDTQPKPTYSVLGYGFCWGTESGTHTWTPEKPRTKPSGSGIPMTITSLIRSLLFLSICTKLNINFSVMTSLQWNSKPEACHFASAKQVLWYLKGIKHLPQIWQHQCRPQPQGIHWFRLGKWLLHMIFCIRILLVLCWWTHLLVCQKAGMHCTIYHRSWICCHDLCFPRRHLAWE